MSSYISMFNSIRAAARRYPDCRIANCDCNSKRGQWKKGCMCLCHFFQMDQKFGADKWTLDDLSKQAKEGMPGEC